MIRAGAALLLALAVSAASREAGSASPAERLGPLFEAVQQRRLFPDGKTFADAVAKRPDAAILADYRRLRPADDAALRRFVLANFDMPGEARAPASPTGPRLPLDRHIASLWPVLTRPPQSARAGSSALALPRPYVVPGGRFRELYYWDSYFTMLGLAADGRHDLVESMIDDFVSLVERYGHVPNGTRTYYLSRSQPPFLYLMVDLSRSRDPAVLARRLRALRAEHDFWVRERSVTMPDGAVLQRYGDGKRTPRDESWREDVETARGAADRGQVWNDLRAGAESGWDFSSRWLGDGRTLATIRTTRIVPVDLNSLLWGLERAIARRAEDAATRDRFRALAAARAGAIDRWLWSEGEGRYGDHDLDAKAIRPGLTAAALYPLYVGMAPSERAKRTATAAEAALLAPGGLRTTTVRTGQQWDRPNGWAPLQWIAVEAFAKAGREDLSRLVASRFLATAEREYRRSGRLLEKYDVEADRPGGGGEYPTQDGFGWTNGTVRAVQLRYGPDARAPGPASINR